MAIQGADENMSLFHFFGEEYATRPQLQFTMMTHKEGSWDDLCPCGICDLSAATKVRTWAGLVGHLVAWAYPDGRS